MFGLKLGKLGAAMRRVFNPQSFFAMGEPGAWYDADDLTDAKLLDGLTLTNAQFLAKYPSHALYQDSAGTLAVKTLEDPVGLVLDKKKGLVLGPELVSTYDFSSGWTTTGTVTNKTATSFDCAADGSGLYKAIWVAPYKRYRFRIVGSTTIAISFAVRNPDDVNAYFMPGGVFDVTFDLYWSNSNRIWFRAQGGGGNITISSISVREIPGNHLIQPTSGNRPTWTRRVNILNATATLATQTATTIAAQYKLSFTGAGSIALSGTATGTITAGTTLVTCTAGTLTLTVTGAVTLADMRLSSDVATPAYQAVVSATSYDYTGFPSKIKHNGTNSFLYTASTMDLSATDNVTMFAGVQKLSDASYPCILELSTNLASNNGSFNIFSGDGVSANSAGYVFGCKGTTIASAIGGSQVSPSTNVLAGVGNISSPLSRIRINGTTVTSTTTTQGTGNFGNYTLYVGARAGTSLWFSGSWTQQIIRGALTSDAQVAQAERFVANKTGVTL